MTGCRRSGGGEDAHTETPAPGSSGAGVVIQAKSVRYLPPIVIVPVQSYDAPVAVKSFPVHVPLPVAPLNLPVPATRWSRRSLPTRAYRPSAWR